MVFVTATSAPTPATSYGGRLGIALAGVFVALVTAQLFSFEKLPQVIDDMWLPGVDSALATVLAACLVSAEVFAVPFLLQMRLSPAMRVVSMGLGWLVGVWWFAVLTWQNINASALANNGLLGATVKLPVGWWSVALMGAILVLIGWVSWSLWPLRRRA